MPTFEQVKFSNAEVDTNKITFSLAYKLIQTEGFIAYEYNPLRNLRASTDRYRKYNNRYITKPQNANYIQYAQLSVWVKAEDQWVKYTTYVDDSNINTKYILSTDAINNNLTTKEGATVAKYTLSDLSNSNNLTSYTPKELFEPKSAVANIKSNSTALDPNLNVGKFIIEYYANELIDFTTPELNFDINHPVNIDIQESYDGSVNLILNDDLNTPKLINSRFTLLEDGKYRVVDRAGNNDTNIYDESGIIGETNLYKTINQIPKLIFSGVETGGELKVGNYVFYFKYVDSDGNETDYVAESGIVTIYQGNINDVTSVKGGLLDTNGYKLVRFILYDIDTAYNYINVYYTRSTGDYNKTEITKAYKIDSKFLVNNSIASITITGLEETSEISLDDINIAYNLIDKAKTQAQVQNRLFLGNVDKTTINYTELTDLSLRITPQIKEVPLPELSYDYITDIYDKNSFEYYNPYNIYNSVGYWEDIYTFGIVYIMNDYTLSPVFPVLGRDIAKGNKTPNEAIYDENGKRRYIEVNDDGYIKGYENYLCNAKGVTRLFRSNSSGQAPYSSLGVEFKFQDNLIDELKKYAKGFFFVRQKRLPTVYCQGLTIGLDQESALPVLPNGINDTNLQYFTESFLSDSNNELLIENNSYNNRIRTTTKATVNAAIIPEAELNSELYSQLFNGSSFTVRASRVQPSNTFLDQGNDERQFYVSRYTRGQLDVYKDNVKLTFIEDNIQLKHSGTQKFSSRAGEIETPYKVSHLEIENKDKKAKNLLRGSWGPYVGIEGFNKPLTLFDVMIPGYSENNLREYFSSRFNNSSPFFTICDRTSFDEVYINSVTCFRGDCFYGNFTHRMCRNFQDPESPTNDTIVDRYTWKNNYSGYVEGAIDLEKAQKINRGDINAVQIGHWITFKCYSNINFAVRCEDTQNASEEALVGHPRSFYPITGFNVSGEYKIPESTCINVGFNSTTSDKYNFLVPDVPYLKNVFANRIMYSNLHISDAFKNAYRVFKLNNYRDYNIEFGYITKILEWYDNLIVVFEHGVALLPVQERVQSASGPGGNVAINSEKVLPERLNPLSRTFGSQWEDSIVKTPYFIYGVDTVGKKIWRTNGQNFEVISDYKVQKFLNDNISLSERERTPLLGIRNVASHYNAFKNDIMFTFYDDIDTNDELGNKVSSREWNLCFNEKLNMWVTKYSWIPLLSENINNVFFTYDKNSAKNVSKVSSSWYPSYTSRGIVLDDCYSKNFPDVAELRSDVIDLKYIEQVDYPGVEFPILNTSYDTDIVIGELKLKLDIDFDILRLNFSLVESTEYPDNNDFYIQKGETDDTKSYLVFRSNTISRTKYLSNVFADLRLEVEIIRQEGVIGKRYTDNVSLRVSKYNDLSSVNSEYEVIDEILESGVNPPIVTWKNESLYNGYTFIQSQKLEELDPATGCEYRNMKCVYENGFWITTKLPTSESFFACKKDNKIYRVWGCREIKAIANIDLNNESKTQSTWFWKHGQAGIFDDAEPIKPTHWFRPPEDKNHDPFEFEFVVNTNIGINKIFNNLKIISNNVAPQTISYEIIGDSYDFKDLKDESFIYQKEGYVPSNPHMQYVEFKLIDKNDPNSPNTIIFYDPTLDSYSLRKVQPIKDMKGHGIIRGNARYKEDFFDITLEPIRYYKHYENETSNLKEARPRDKFIKIRVKYAGDRVVLITALQTMFDISYS